MLSLLATAHACNFIDYCNGNPVGWGSAGASANAQYSSIGQAKEQILTIANPPSGNVYISLYGVSAASGVTVSIRY